MLKLITLPALPLAVVMPSVFIGQDIRNLLEIALKRLKVVSTAV